MSRVRKARRIKQTRLVWKRLVGDLCSLPRTDGRGGAGRPTRGDRQAAAQLRRKLAQQLKTIWTAATCQFAAWKKRTPPCGLCHTPRPSLVKSLLKTRNFKFYTKSRLHLSGCRECLPLAALCAWTSENCENHPFSVLRSQLR